MIDAKTYVEYRRPITAHLFRFLLIKVKMTDVINRIFHVYAWLTFLIILSNVDNLNNRNIYNVLNETSPIIRRNNTFVRPLMILHCYFVELNVLETLFT